MGLLSKLFGSSISEPKRREIYADYKAALDAQPLRSAGELAQKMRGEVPYLAEKAVLPLIAKQHNVSEAQVRKIFQEGQTQHW